MNPDWQPQFVPPPTALPGGPPPPPSKLSSVPTLGTLMIVHGALVLAWALFCIFAIVVGIVNVAFIGADFEGGMIIGIYSVFGLSALAVSITNIIAGIHVRKLRSKKLAFGALIGGSISFFCGNVFCMPLTIALLIYGIIVLTDAGVSAAFARVAAGEAAERVLAGG